MMFTAFNDESYPNRILRRSFYDKHTPNLMLGITPIEEEIRSTARFRYSFASKEISSGAGPLGCSSFDAYTGRYTQAFI